MCPRNFRSSPKIHFAPELLIDSWHLVLAVETVSLLWIGLSSSTCSEMQATMKALLFTLLAIALIGPTYAPVSPEDDLGDGDFGSGSGDFGSGSGEAPSPSPPPSPPPSPSPSLPPPSPWQPWMSVVAFVLELAGDVSSFSLDVREQMKRAIAGRAGVDPSAVTVTVTSGSVIVDVRIWTPTATANSVHSAMVSATSTLNSANAMFASVSNVTVITIRTSPTVAAYTPPSEDYQKDGLGVGIIIAIAIGASVATLVVLCIFYYYYRQAAKPPVFRPRQYL